MQMMKNFLQRICRLKCQYTLINREQQCLDEIKQVVGTQDVLVLCSGGVDSTVCAALCTKALGPDRVVCSHFIISQISYITPLFLQHAIHIDNGFMRLDESEHVIKSLNALGLS